MDEWRVSLFSFPTHALSHTRGSLVLWGFPGKPKRGERERERAACSLARSPLLSSSPFSFLNLGSLSPFFSHFNRFYGPRTKAFALTHAPPSGPLAPTWPPSDVWTVSAPAMGIATADGTKGSAGALFLYRLLAGPGAAQGTVGPNGTVDATAPAGRLYYGDGGSVGVAGPLGLPVA